VVLSLVLVLVFQYILSCAIVDDNCLSQPNLLHSLQPSVTAGTDLTVSNTESRQDADVIHKSNSGKNIVIRHDQIPLKARCQRCSFTCNNDSQLALHMKTGHVSVCYKPGNFKCPKCGMNTPKKEVLFWHLSHHTGNHSIMYYACSGCNAEKQCAVEVREHIAKKHVDGSLQCSAVALVENVRYLQNIMKCPVCRDGLLWKQIFIKHLQDKHNLSYLASYLSENYGDSCPDFLSFPRHLLKSCAINYAEHDTEEVKSSETSAVSRFHCDNCEFSTNDRDAHRQHQRSHSQTRTELSSDENTCSIEAALSNNVLIDKAKPHRSAKIKAYSQILMSPVRTPSLPEQQRQSSKRKARKVRRKSFPYFSKTKNAADTPAVSQAASKSVANFSKTKSSADAPAVSKKTKPASAKDTDFFTEFVNKLPGSFVFGEDIKCPKCYFASRVRVNLVRHVKSHLTADNKNASASGSNGHLSYDLWQPDRSERRDSVPSDKSVEEEATGRGSSEVKNKNDDKASHISLNKRDNASQEQLMTAEVDSFSRSESRNSCSGSDVDDSSANECNDEMSSAQPEILSCETCSEQFDSDVSLEQHISGSHGGPYVCHMCGILMWQQNAVRSHYSVVHPGSPLQFEMLHRKVGDGSREVDGSGTSKKKIARVQGNSTGTCRVATNLEYSGISLNMGNSGNSRGILCNLREKL